LRAYSPIVVRTVPSLVLASPKNGIAHINQRAANAAGNGIERARREAFARDTMRIPARILILCSVLVIGVDAAPLRAEPIDVTITITSGSVSFYPELGLAASPLQLYGTDGFSLLAAPGSGATAPQCCLAPGATTFFRASWLGNDLLGTATYNGDTFSNVGSLASNNVAGVDFVSSPFTLPSPGSETSTTITAPFTLTGFFRGSPGSGTTPTTVNATLVGSGTGTILFTLVPGLPFIAWEPRLASLQIGAADAVPEPTSIVLACLSLAGVYGATRHRRRAGR
jgi:hypothetical protein